ncbi:hypothetical protein TNCT_209011 [Trichonephila clavata]|uniref:Uncharacterized protein n=1 Tax=Trichonephila clavata TaxID=2740835 RepID=A0A8X6J481_TRICU|nr:hypothetical protein TNCT_209011 [Trichonephila clavata]
MYLNSQPALNSSSPLMSLCVCVSWNFKVMLPFVSPKTRTAPLKHNHFRILPNNESLFSGPLIQMMAALFTFVFIIPWRDAESVQNLTNRDSSRCALLSRPEK